jgi:hypothetical protein
MPFGEEEKGMQKELSPERASTREKSESAQSVWFAPF